jgi:hypothetical protein
MLKAKKRPLESFVGRLLTSVHFGSCFLLRIARAKRLIVWNAETTKIDMLILLRPFG